MMVAEYFRMGVHALNLVVIGCGGTGSLLLQHLARINKTLLSQGGKGIMVTCIDDDLINEANIGRQLFTESDIGRPKAVVCVERINRFFGTHWNAVAVPFDNKCTLIEALPGNILISCTDTAQSRINIQNYLIDTTGNRYFEQYQNHYWIDTGNSRYAGQVILGSKRHDIPTVIDRYPNIKSIERRAPQGPSCSLAEAVLEQDLFINPMMAMVAGQLVWNITQQKELLWTNAYINLNRKVPIRYTHYGDKMDR